MGGTGSKAELKSLGDVAVPDIVGLQYNSREETIKTRSITRTSTWMRVFALPQHQLIALLRRTLKKSAYCTCRLSSILWYVGCSWLKSRSGETKTTYNSPPC